MRIESTFYVMEWLAFKNRINSRIRGFWQKPEQEPLFFDHWKQILDQTKPGFTLLVDASDFITPPQVILNLISQAQRMSMEKGVARRAEIHPESFISALATKYAAEQSGILDMTEKFASREKAEQWLDGAPRKD